MECLDRGKVPRGRDFYRNGRVVIPFGLRVPSRTCDGRRSGRSKVGRGSDWSYTSSTGLGQVMLFRRLDRRDRWVRRDY